MTEAPLPKFRTGTLWAVLLWMGVLGLLVVGAALLRIGKTEQSIVEDDHPGEYYSLDRLH